MSKESTSPFAWASIERLCFDELTFSNKNLFPMKTPLLTLSIQLEKTILINHPAWFLGYHKLLE